MPPPFHPFCTIFYTVLKLPGDDPFLEIFSTFEKNSRICSTGLETDCKPVLLSVGFEACGSKAFPIEDKHLCPAGFAFELLQSYISD